jgi:hypothetical protein|tara:strand:- start:1315 stop:1542 length:228 start_codon:yes stop_codon:yes gene_type:complete
MIKSQQLESIIRMFNDKSIVGKESRASVETPDGEMWDIKEIFLAQNKIIGSRETHRLVIRITKETAPPGEVIGKL